jgi:hypothetical protein
MSEFKFACPVCGQHITADSSAAGSQLDCPTCFRKIVVPQAPLSTESKFVLSASEATRPRPSSPTTASPAAGKRGTRAGRPMLVVVVAVAIVLGVGAASLLFFPGNPFGSSQSSSQTGANSGKADATALRRIPSGTVPWTLDLSRSGFPAETAFGRIHGEDFVCDRAVLQGGTLNLRMGREWPPDLGLSVYLYARQPEELSGKSAQVSTNSIRSPRLVLRWKEDGRNRTKTFTNGFALKLEFGALNGNRMPGKIYLCLPDESQTCVAGVFNAEIRRPAQPKP